MEVLNLLNLFILLIIIIILIIIQIKKIGNKDIEKIIDKKSLCSYDNSFKCSYFWEYHKKPSKDICKKCNDSKNNKIDYKML